MRDAEEQRTGAGSRAPTGAAAAVEALEHHGVSTVFGIPGGAILPLYDELTRSFDIRHVLARHEQGAGHAAEGYARATGKVGVCLATSGPGATNLITPLANASMDSTPLVAITGQVPSWLRGTAAFQETDICSVAQPLVKRSFRVTRPDEVHEAMREAFRTALHGRPGPVLVDITKDALQGRAEPTNVSLREDELPPRSERRLPSADRLHAAAEHLRRARRPVLYVGGGAVASGAREEVLDLLAITRAPVVTTLMAKGIVPENHPQHLGMPGMHGTVSAVVGLQHSDLIVAVGARFDDRVTGRIDTFARDARIVHIDVDPSEINKLRRADVALQGDACAVLTALNEHLREQPPTSRNDSWWQRLSRWQKRYDVGTPSSSRNGVLHTRDVLTTMRERCPDGTVFTTGVGQHQMWAAQLLSLTDPRSWITSGGAGTMGYAVPAAMGAKLARPCDSVWAIEGDGGFQMTCQELASCAAEGIAIKVAVLNNGTLGMVRQWQDVFLEQQYSATTLDRDVPDNAALARAMGCVGLHCARPEEVGTVLAEAEATSDAPMVIDFRVDATDLVWPMVPAGASNDDILVSRNEYPNFDHVEG
ncbi:acetolactate synthase, large subunit, biosynthetic type [Actinopolyspora mortivallis]|uniref:Acetolactate synthase n=1 Tax=Actinopolyspora mortivallis TaxID=33906 RepID=A0A2T0GWP7_ACTMO|nr:acetolactate synthase, large subunit, biosynthetic type [Actinopolyspora mortivallis]